MHILFICTGNICRSPMAERLATAFAAEADLTNFTASSAGTRAVIGHAIHDSAARIIQQSGGDTTGFAARQFNPKIASGADLILTMTKAHRDAVLETAPLKLHRTFTLGEAARLVSEHNARAVSELSALRPHLSDSDSSDIPDPIGQSDEVFEQVGAHIADLLPPILGLCRS
ncbi:arsenate reductase/protein-tyrosine-phosphatase family protein [Mycolicibacterium sp. Dal123E01]|uniref:arsenate reductase/protein-tyrosine-phosphatase family protein n=1 Tax=Mycolicibacterium sp. Dal123E01 TaxID=3457578 RepID=UPI00403E4FDF